MKMLRVFVVVGLVFVAMLMAIPYAFGEDANPSRLA